MELELEEKEKETSTLKERLVSSSQELELTKSALASSASSVPSSETQIQELKLGHEAEIKTLTDQLANTYGRLGLAQDDLAMKTAESKLAREKLHEAEEINMMMSDKWRDTREELADLQAATTTKDAKISDLKNSLSAAKKDITALRATLSDTQKSLSSAEKELITLREDYAARELVLEETQALVDQLKLSSAETDQSLTSLQAELAQKSKELHSTKIQLGAQNANLEVSEAREVMLVGKLEEAAKACEVKDELVKNLQHESDEVKEKSACVCKIRWNRVGR